MECCYKDFLQKGSCKADYAENILLTYVGYYPSKEPDGTNVGEWDKERFIPYVAHLNEKGLIDDYFFDSFVFAALRSPYNGCYHRYYDWVTNSREGRKEDWQWLIDKLFSRNKQLQALDQAMGQVNEALKGNRKAKVFLLIPFPDVSSKKFGSLEDENICEDLSSVDARNRAIKWYLDELINRFNDMDYRNLKLSGFYWMQEDVDPSVSGEVENIKYTIDYLHSKGFKIGWIPWSGAALKEKGSEIGFDFTLIQPNHYFQTETDIGRIEKIANIANESNSGIEIEFDVEVLNSEWHKESLNNYLDGGIRYGYMNNSLLGYYQGVYGLYNMYYSENPEGKKVYDDIYSFSKGRYMLNK